jgi:integrase
MKVRGHLKSRSKGSWSLVIDHGRDPETKKRKQKWVTFHGSRQDAQKELTKLLGKVDDGTFVEKSKETLVEFLRRWLQNSVTPNRRPETARVYGSIIEGHIAKHAIGAMPLQQVRASHLEKYLAEVKGAASSVAVHHAILRRALRIAVKDELLAASPAVDLDRRRPSKDIGETARVHCWSATEARRFIDAAKKASPQLSAFCQLALDTGARKSELHGLRWSDLDLDATSLTIERQLDRGGAEPVFGPTKTKQARTIRLGAETVDALRRHKAAQAEVKMANRTTYKDHGLIFAKEPEDIQTPGSELGQPLTTLSERRYKSLLTDNGIRVIKFHGLRHTCATLLLAAGQPAMVVAARLGHAKVTMTLEVYAHANDDMQRAAAAQLASVLHG